MKFVPDAVTRAAGANVLKLKGASPKLLFVAGVVGVGATVVLACRATMKVEGVLDEHQETLKKMHKALSYKRSDYSEEDFNKDKVILTIQTGVKIGKLYALPFAIGVLSIGALTGSHIQLTRRNAASAAAYAATEDAFRRYRSRVRGELGDDKDHEFRYGHAKKVIVEETEEGVKKVETTVWNGDEPSGLSRIFGQDNRNWQKRRDSNLLFIRAQQLFANEKLRLKGYLFLNDVQDAMGLSRTVEGQVLGWLYDPDKPDHNQVDLGIFEATEWRMRDGVLGESGELLLDFNVYGNILDDLERFER